jgi:hypothetical protein
MNIPPVSASYEQTVGAFARMLGEASGHESSDPAKIAQAIVELANREDAPAELLLGADTVKYVKQAADAVAESDRKWHDFFVSVKAG